MAEKAKTANKNNSNVILGICAAVAILVIVVIAIVLATGGGNKLGDGYFVSDGSKYVLTLSTEGEDDGEMVPVKAHVVYYYSGDTITDMKGFYEFKDENTAKTAYDFYNGNNDGSYKAVERNGKYVILTANETDYQGLTATDVKQQIENIEAAEKAVQEASGGNTEAVEKIEGTPAGEEIVETVEANE